MICTFLSRALLAAGTVAMLMASAPARAQFALPDGVRITVGASAVTAPLYEGSNRYGFWALPIIKFGVLKSATPSSGTDAGPGGLMGLLSSLDTRALDDISIGIVRHGGFQAGLSTGYRTGRLEKDSARLAGLGDIDGGIVAGGYLRYDLGRYYARASLHQRITGDDTGLVARFVLGSRFALTDRIVVKADGVLELADGAYMDAFFGVTARQSARTGLRVYDPGAGPKNAGVRFTTELALTPDWTLEASAGYSRLLADAASSPIIQSADRFDARIGLSRSFDLRLK